MLKIKPTSKFKKDLRLIAKRRRSIEPITKVINMIAAGAKLPDKYCDHSLSGGWTGFRECHIEPDWLLIYKIHNEELILTLSRTGSHSDLF